MAGMDNFRDKVAVITGGASGIGRGMAEELIARGAKVVIADIEEDRLRGVAREIGATGICTDVSDQSSMAALREEVLAHFGTVHLLCNNAGVGPIAKMKDMTISDWKWMMDVNFWGCVYGVDQFLPILLGNPEGGYILNTASMGGVVHSPDARGLLHLEICCRGFN